MGQVSEAAQTGDILVTLIALRNKLAAEIDDCDSKRDLASLAKQLTDALIKIDEVIASRPAEKESVVDAVIREHSDKKQGATKKQKNKRLTDTKNQS